MQVLRIFRLRDSHQQQYRWAPHTSGASTVKPKDYVEEGTVEADSVYGAWLRLKGSGSPLRVGDLLELPTGDLRICKYIGFEEAKWLAPEAKPENEDGGAQGSGSSPEVGASSEVLAH